jgi:Zn-finger nucleic acid-binding protein
MMENDMRCPVDGETLVMADRSGVEIDYCPKCRGVWLDRGELDKIVERASMGAPAPMAQPPMAPPMAPQRQAAAPMYQPEPARGSQYEQPRRKHDDDDDDRYHGKKKKRDSFLSDIFDF